MTTREMTVETASVYFSDGYRFFVGSYYGESEVEDFEEVVDALSVGETEEWLYVESVTVDDSMREVHIFIGDDE